MEKKKVIYVISPQAVESAGFKFFFFWRGCLVASSLSKAFYSQGVASCTLSHEFMRTWQPAEGVPKTLQLVWWQHEMEPDPASSGCSK